MSPDVLLECPRTSFRDVLRVNVTERVWHSPHNFSTCLNHIHFAGHLDIFLSWGGAFFLNQLLTGQHLANSGGGGQLKKSPCIFLLIFIFLYTASGDVKVFLSPCSSFKMAHLLKSYLPHEYLIFSQYTELPLLC